MTAQHWKRLHWKRLRAEPPVYAMMIKTRDGVRWCAKVLHEPGGTWKVRVWLETVLVREAIVAGTLRQAKAFGLLALLIEAER